MNTFEPGRKCCHSMNQCVHSRPIGREAQPAFLFHTYCQKVDEMHVNVIEITINFTDTFVVLAILDIALCCLAHSFIGMVHECMWILRLACNTEQFDSVYISVVILWSQSALMLSFPPFGRVAIDSHNLFARFWTNYL